MGRDEGWSAPSSSSPGRSGCVRSPRGSRRKSNGRSWSGKAALWGRASTSAGRSLPKISRIGFPDCPPRSRRPGRAFVLHDPQGSKRLLLVRYLLVENLDRTGGYGELEEAVEHSHL